MDRHIEEVSDKVDRMQYQVDEVQAALNALTRQIIALERDVNAIRTVPVIERHLSGDDNG